jgi:lysylphosphatidylglycerol synthetase-like protein (DUF2156 family)
LLDRDEGEKTYVLLYYYTICIERETHHNFWRIKYRSNLDARTAATTTFLSYILIYIGSLSLSLSRSLISSSIRICSHVRLYKCFSTDFLLLLLFLFLVWLISRRGKTRTEWNTSEKIEWLNFFCFLFVFFGTLYVYIYILAHRLNCFCVKPFWIPRRYGRRKKNKNKKKKVLAYIRTSSQ